MTRSMTGKRSEEAEAGVTTVALGEGIPFPPDCVAPCHQVRLAFEKYCVSLPGVTGAKKQVHALSETTSPAGSALTPVFLIGRPSDFSAGHQILRGDNDVLQGRVAI